MKIAIVDPELNTFPYDFRLCDALGNNGNEVVFITRKLEGGEELKSGTFTCLNHFYRVSARLKRKVILKPFFYCIKLGEHLCNMVALLYMLKKWQPAVIHFQWFTLPIFDHLLLRYYRTVAPVILTVHDSNPLQASLSSKLQTICWQKTVFKVDHILVHTYFSRDKLIAIGVKSHKITVVPHGLLDYEVETSRSPKTDGADKYLLFFGHIKPYKGLDLLIRALSLISIDMRKQITLIVAGAPKTNMKKYYMLAESLGVMENIIWDLRYIPDDEVPNLFHRADLVVFPYREIDASGVLMLSLSFGNLVLATDIGGFSSILKEKAASCLVAFDAVQLAGSIEKILSDSNHREKMYKNLKELKDSLLSWEDIGFITLNIYEQLAGKKMFN